MIQTKPTSLRDKAAQLVFARIGSNMPPPVTVREDAARMEALLERCPLGGMILFNGEVPETPEVLARLQAKSPFPLLVATDMERGVGQQVRGATVFPHAMAYAALGDEAEAAVEASARISAREALACGIHLTFSPVADVNRDRRNPIIATRAYGDEPGGVARLATAYIRGCHAEGLLTTAKHYPGHGGTSQDSHEEMPVVHDNRGVLERSDLQPFRDVIDAGVDVMMTAHISVPALDPSGLPATLSAPILRDLLRDDLGFGGAVVTDSLLMGAIRAEPGDVGAQAAALVQAGVDIVLDSPDPKAAVAGLVEAVANGDLDEARLDEAYERVWALKQKLLDRFGPTIFTAPHQHIALDEVGAASHHALAEDIARRAVSINDPKGQLPLQPGEGEGLMVLLIKPHRSRLDPPEAPLAAALREAYPGVIYFDIGPETDEAALREILAQAQDVQHVVIAMIVKPAAWHPFGLLPAQQQLVDTLVAQRPVVLASLGSPYIFDAFPDDTTRLCTFSDVAASQRALVSVLAGASGKGG